MRSAWPLVVLFAAFVGCKAADTPTDMGDTGMADMSAASPDLARGPDLAKAASCTDTIRNGMETDVDCGGGACPPCDVGKACRAGADCATALCTGNKCVAPGCMDGIQNGDETGVDCGGSCMKGCLAGAGCKKPADCASGVCTASLCQAPGCGDGLANGSETDVDCGGGACEQCGAGKKCAMDSDCFTKLCDPISNVCVGCGDGKKNGAETDVDCGGKLCGPCGLGRACLAPADCTSNLCNGNNACAACTQDSDCPFKICKQGVCSSAPIVGMMGGQTFFKVQVAGAMTDTNVFNACKAAGLNTPCQAMGKCMYNDNLCTMTTEPMCGNPMQKLSQTLCNGQGPPMCPALFGVYQYMGHVWQNDSACGAEQNMWCAVGSMAQNRFALCVN